MTTTEPHVERLMARMQERMGQKAPQTTNWGSRLAIRATPRFLALVHQAAMARDISMGAYVRRCVTAFVCSDLDLPYDEVLAMSPYPSAYGKSKPDKENTELYRGGKSRGRVAVPDDGEGFGQWPWSSQ